MKLPTILLINNKNLKNNPKKALFLIIPVFVLISMSFVISSQINNIREALELGVFSTISDQYAYLSVKTEEEEFDPMMMFRSQSSFEQNQFSVVDEQNIESIEGVKSASLQTSLEIGNVATSDLFENKELDLSSMVSLDEDVASIFTEESFIYSEGDAIPIILSANSFVYTYEDWSDGDVITVQMGDPGSNRESGEKSNRVTVEKTEALTFDKSELLGQEFNISFGSLDEIKDYSVEMDRETRTMTITKMSSEDYLAELKERENEISQYWDYDTLSESLTYTFEIVAVDEDETSTLNYIPESFVTVLMKDYFEKELNSRISEIPEDLLNSDFIGMTYDGDELTWGMVGMMSQIGGRMGGGIMPGGEMESGGSSGSDFAAIKIPGLVVEVDDNGDIIGTLDNPNIYEEANVYSNQINIQLDSVTDRTSVVKSLNSAGYAYQDLGDMDVFENLEASLQSISNGFLIGFIAIVGLVVILTMSKLVTEGIKEIGIFRAMGMKKNKVLLMFVLRSLLFTAIGYLGGLILGLFANLLVSGFVANWFASFINNTVSESFNVVNSVDAVIFNGVNWSSVAIYSVLLFVIAIVVSIIPSMNASNVSPVEAIKSE